MSIEETIAELERSLDPRAKENFGVVERFLLRQSMVACRMQSLPPVRGPDEGERASGDMICAACGKNYYSHPADWRLIGYGDIPFLNVLCCGRRVKL